MVLIKGKINLLASTLLLTAITAQMATANIASDANTKSVAQTLSTPLYSVAHVKEKDNLNVRAGAGVSNEVVTTIPFDGNTIELLGDEATLGKTHWVLIKWKGITGWVSKYYLTAEKAKVEEAVASVSTDKEEIATEIEQKTEATEVEKVAITDQETDVAAEETVAKTNTEAVKVEATADEPQEEWVLRCGNKTPYWKVDVHPKWMDVLKGDYETGLPITKKKQDKNRWNTALKTVVHGKNGRNNLQMTIKYAYSKRCYDTLSGLRVPYKVVTQFNGEELTGCCRAVKVALPQKTKAAETKVSMK